jgi:chromosome partitioning protein
LDVNRLRPSLELLRDIEAERGRLKVAILFTRWDGRQILAREAQEALESFPVIDAKIRQLARYAQAFGERPTYLDEYAAVWRELRS